jgi:ApbE superfamily uncharacterized protein (UPF0280 family)
MTMPEPQVSFLPDGRRLHLHHGPIDLIVDAEGPGRVAALDAARARFATILDELVAELAVLRSAVGSGAVTGRVAMAMVAAVTPFAAGFITPMAAVAGAVADEILGAMTGAGDLTRAYVNNGGDVALHLGPGARFIAAADAGDRVTIAHHSPVRGVATSGWRGRSHSLGIADTVTVLARTAASADAAATMIANAVDLPGSAKVHRVAACDLSPDSDLGGRLVTVDVAPLDPAEVDLALDRGFAFARACVTRGLIVAALLTLNGQRRIAGRAVVQDIKEKDRVHA